MPEEKTAASGKPMIAARERGPGPARYKLPACLGLHGHDLTKRIMPSHTFGRRLNINLYRNECSPGPAYLVTHTRFGLDGTPVYSMLGRAKDARCFKTPAPSAYYRERVHPQGERKAPVYSMGSRTKYRKKDANPASSSYTLPSMLGYGMPTKLSAPAYTMGPKGPDDHDPRVPGPGRYDDVKLDTYINKAPVYSMLGKTQYVGGLGPVPGPGAHSPEKVYINKPAAPIVSMGIRHSEYLTPMIVEVQD